MALLVQELARRLPGDDGRVVVFTSDALTENVPYGVSKGALDRIVRAAAVELGSRGIRANCINPGPTETGWISQELRNEVSRRAPLGRPSLPQDSANLVAFLLSKEGGCNRSASPFQWGSPVMSGPPRDQVARPVKSDLVVTRVVAAT